MRNRTHRLNVLLAALAVQLLAFYALPLLAGPTDMMGLVFLLVAITFVLSIVVGAAVEHKAKHAYPVATAVAFIPSVFIYYNETALVHAAWYLVVSLIGLTIGSLAKRLTQRDRGPSV